MSLLDDINAARARTVVYLDQDGAAGMYCWRCEGCSASKPFDGDYEIVTPFPHADGCRGRSLRETAPCRFCAGTGRVELAQCAEIVNGRPCKRRTRASEDPSYLAEFPEREHLRPYCGFHGNARVRAEWRAEYAVADRALASPDV